MPPESQNGSLTSSSASSIGKNSDASSGCGGEEEEVQSESKGGALNCFDALEEVLPVKKSISRYYCGKSKSFTSLSDAASCSSIKEITKPENDYTRKRKNLLPFNNFLDRNQNMSRSNNDGISKRHTHSRSMLSLVGSFVNNNSSTSNLLPPSCCLPPLPPVAQRFMHYEPPVSSAVAKFSLLRSFSLSDFQGDAAVEASSGNVLQNIQN